MSNRLAQQSSPYLLQHAHNPVDWYPWGPEALALAREEDRPILLSIGYSACHWCHVMERESFEDPATAEVMNRDFVNVKVDREERPDLDAIYMKAVQAMSGQGGWPLTVFLTPAGEPFFGGTYFPPQPLPGRASFRQVLEAVEQAYRQRRDQVERAAGELLEVVRRSAGPPAHDAERDPPGPDFLDRVFRVVASQFDAMRGGFGQAPKFPQPVVLDFLLRHHARTGNDHALLMVTHTLRRMARGGMRDQLDGGFHRYSVDERWLVPHFEKMLYDNALLSRVYLHAWQLTGDAEHRDTATRCLDYVLDDLTAPEDGFYSARDADSEGEEGTFYLWTPDQVGAVLGAGTARVFCRFYDVSAGGNFEGRSILHQPHDLDAVANAAGVDPAELARDLARGRAQLLEARAARPAPFRDDKVLTGWSAMMVRSLAEAGGALGEARYVEAARRGATFLLEALRVDGALAHTWRDGSARIGAFLEDYGALGNALLTLHEATLDPVWLVHAREMAEAVLARFVGPGGVLYDTADDAEALVVRPRDPMDSATPSGTSLAVELLLRAGEVFDEDRYRELARSTLAREASTVERYPLAFGRLLSCMELAAAGFVEIALVGPADAAGTRALRDVAMSRYLPNRALVAGPGPSGPEAPPALDLPLLRGRSERDGLPTAYVCRNYACDAPVTDPESLSAQLP